MINLNLEMADVVEAYDTPLHANSIGTPYKHIVSGDGYIFGIHEPYYDKDDLELVMLDTQQQDDDGYDIYPISYFLGCNGKDTTFALHETIEVAGEQHYSLIVQCATDNTVI